MEIVVLTVAFLAYCAVVITAAVVHEPWWDESQAWLIARDASIADLCTHVLRYEGHPPLWYLILAVPAKLGVPHEAMKVIAILAGATTAFLILFALRWIPLLLRVVLPFSFFFAYHWTVVARSYVLLPPLLLGIAYVWDQRSAHPWRFMWLLIALSQVSVHGFAMAIVLLAVSIFETRPRRPAIAPLVAFGLNAMFLIVVLWPPRDAISADLLGPSLSLRRHSDLVSTIVPSMILESNDDADAFRALGLIVLALAGLTTLTAWIFRSGAGWPFIAAMLAVYGVSLRYFSEWHEGIFYSVLIFGAALSFRAKRSRSWLCHAALAILLCLALRHAYWTFTSISYDVKYPFTGSAAAARYIREQGIDRRNVYGAGQPAVELQAYFPAQLFANGRRQAYWEWSRQNPWPSTRYTDAHKHKQEVTRWMAKQLADKPEFFVCSVWSTEEEFYLEALLADPSYRRMATFTGMTIWKTSPRWRITFHVFQRVDR